LAAAPGSFPLFIMASVYILHSPSVDKFYTGSCQEIPERIHQHLIRYFPKAFTSQARDWVIYFQIDNLGYSQARKIEKHIKRMKSKKYFEDLKRYPELTQKLVELYRQR
jgi:putative endonuclease